MLDNVTIAGTLAAYDLGQMLKNAQKTFTTWGGYLIMLIGVVMLIWCGVKVAKGLMSHGKEPTNWLMVFMLGLVGGAFMIGGFAFISNLAGGAQSTLEAVVNGTAS